MGAVKREIEDIAEELEREWESYQKGMKETGAAYREARQFLRNLFKERTGLSPFAFARFDSVQDAAQVVLSRKASGDAESEHM